MLMLICLFLIIRRRHFLFRCVSSFPLQGCLLFTALAETVFLHRQFAERMKKLFVTRFSCCCCLFAHLVSEVNVAQTLSSQNVVAVFSLLKAKKKKYELRILK